MASTDNFYAMVGFFVVGIFVFVLAVVWSNFLSVDALWEQADYGQTIKNNTDSFFNKIDFIMICLYFGVHLSVIVLSYMLRTHPVVYVVSIFLTILLVVIAAPLSNAWEDLSQDTAFDAIRADYPGTNHIMSKLPFYELLWAGLTMILLYGFARYEGVT